MAKSRVLSRASLVYLVGYLWGGGLGLVVAPGFALGLLQSNGAYGEVLPRMLGMLMLALGTLVAEITRQGVHTLYRTAVIVRLGLCAGLVWLYTVSGDPLFVVLLGIVGLGVALTVAGLALDAREPAGVRA